MHSKKKSTAPCTRDRGVNATTCSFTSDDGRNVEEYIKRTIDTMGPTSPQFSFANDNNNNDTDADNEESVYTNASIYASYTKIKGTPADVILSSRTSDLSVTHDSQETQRDVTWCSLKEPCDQHHTCVCQHYRHQFVRIKNNNDMPPVTAPPKGKKLGLSSRFKSFCQRAKHQHEPMEFYKVNITQARKEESPPRRFVFDLVDDVPKPDTHTVATNTKSANVHNFAHNYGGNVGMHVPRIVDHKMPFHENVANTRQGTDASFAQTDYAKSRVDIYYFDHGNAAYYRTTDTSPLLMTEVLAEKTEIYTSRFWAQLFGTVHIGFAFVTSFILQLLRFLLQSLIRPLTVGITQMFSDYFCKPFLAVTYNGVIQPPMILLYNVATSVRDVCEPIAESLGCYIREISVFFRAIRLVDIKKNKGYDCEMGKKCSQSEEKKVESKCDCSEKREDSNE